jgi:hypothetical protein
MDIEKTMEFILNSQAQAEVHMEKIREAQDRTDGQLDKLERRLNLAVRLAIREARNERLKRREMDARFTAAQSASYEKQSAFDEKMTQLAAAQLVTEEKLQAFIEAMRQGKNGHT